MNRIQRFTCILVVVGLLWAMFGLPLPAQADVLAQEIVVNFDDGQFPADWEARNAEVVNGELVLTNGGFSMMNTAWLDADWSVRFWLEANSKVILRYSNSIFDVRTLTISASGIEFIRETGSPRSNTVSTTSLGKSEDPITPGEWHLLEVRAEKDKLTLSIDGSLRMNATKGYTPNRGVALSSGGTVRLDDLSASQIPPVDPVLASLPAETLGGWIAYLGLDYGLWLVHPDGSGARSLPFSSVGRVEFSPDGSMLVVESQGILNVVEVESGQILHTFNEGKIFVPTWSADSRLLAFQLDPSTPNDLTLKMVEAATGAEVRRVQVPQQAGGETLFSQYPYLGNLAWSPDGSQFATTVQSSENGGFIYRPLLVSATDGSPTLLPGSGLQIWSRDGQKLYSTAGGEIDPASLTFREFSAQAGGALQQGELFLSPDGKRIAVAGIEDFSLVELESGQTAKIQERRFIGWAPDSRHVVVNRVGRIFIVDTLTGAEAQIGAGSPLAWQPDPALVEKLGAMALTGEASPTPPPAESAAQPSGPAPAATQARVSTAAGETEAQGAAPAQTAKSGSPLKRGFGVIMLLFGLLLAGAAFWFVPRLKELEYKTPIRIGLGLIGLAVLVIGAALVFSKTPQSGEQAGASPANPAATRAPESGAPDTATEEPNGDKPQNQGSLDSPCMLVDLERDSFTKLISAEQMQINNPLAILSEYYALALTPQSESQQKTMEARLSTQQAENTLKMCSISALVFSPQGDRFAVFGTSPQGGWLVMYDAQSLRPRNLIRFDPETWSWGNAPGWSPDGRLLAYFTNDETLVFIDADSLQEVNRLAPSIRSGSNESNKDMVKDYRWLPDGRIIRKINDALQVYDIARGEVVQEVRTDDGKMGNLLQEPGTFLRNYKTRISPDGSLMISVPSYPAANAGSQSNSYNPKFWDTQTGETVKEVWTQIQPGAGLAWSPDSRLVAMGDIYGRYLVMLSVERGDAYPIQIPTEGFHLMNNEACAFAPDGNSILLSGNNQLLRYALDKDEFVPIPLPEGVTYVECSGWLAGGRQVVFWDYITPAYWIYDVDTGQLTNLADADSLAGQP